MPARRLTFVSRPRWTKRHLVPPGYVGPLLTFDDGPDPDATPRLLDALVEAGRTAIFFVVGERAKRYPALLRRMANDGHEIGNHSFSHPKRASYQKWREELEHCQAVVANATGIAPKWFRPPYGRVTVMNWLAARMGGLRMLLWSLDSNDWRMQDAERCVRELREEVRVSDVVLLHDHATSVWNRLLGEPVALATGGLPDAIAA
jgi:peptidoglycan/xylan/chitin deacetylase (PgdA/CDA1 family)